MDNIADILSKILLITFLIWTAIMVVNGMEYHRKNSTIIIYENRDVCFGEKDECPPCKDWTDLQAH